MCLQILELCAQAASFFERTARPGNQNAARRCQTRLTTGIGTRLVAATEVPWLSVLALDAEGLLTAWHDALVPSAATPLLYIFPRSCRCWRPSLPLLPHDPKLLQQFADVVFTVAFRADDAPAFDAVGSLVVLSAEGLVAEVVGAPVTLITLVLAFRRKVVVLAALDASARVLYGRSFFGCCTLGAWRCHCRSARGKERL